MRQTAIVIGSGWAGEGHSLALRSAGVEVIALCGRSPEPTQALAQRLGIPLVRFDWQNAISELQPDIVAIATPAAPHRLMAEAAANQGCHILCDKPLALDAAEARRMLLAVREAGVRHAYGASSCLGPAIDHARTLLTDGLLGTLTGVESTRHFGQARPWPYSWVDVIREGGGMLNNLFTHKLAQVLRVTGGTPTHAMGEARCYVTRAPVGPPIHDFRELFRPMPEVDESDSSLWRTVDADTDYSVILQLASPGGQDVPARFYGGLTSKGREDEVLALYGTKGTLILSGHNSPTELHHYDHKRETWEQLTVPTSGDDVLAIDDPVQRDWNVLVKQFVADIRREAHAFYPTFEDGWLAAEIIGIVRQGQGRTAVPRSPSRSQT